MADRQRVYEGRPGLAEWGEDLGEFDPRVLRAVRAGFKANVMPSPSGVPFAGLVESTKSLPALPMFLGDLFTGGKYGLSESAPEFALEASEKYDELIQKYLAEEGLREAARLGVPEKFGLAAGEMLGQLPVPGKLLERVTKKLPKAFKPAGWLAEYFGPTVDPKAINYAIGTGVGGTLRTATGEEEPEKFARGGLGRKSIVRKTEEGVTEAAPPKLEGTTIVKPVGNLNLAPAIRVESIKGPEKQTPQSILNQAQKIPGVTKEGFEEATKAFRQLIGKYEGEPVTVSKTDFEGLIPPSQYSKVDLAGSADSAWDHYVDMATEMANNDLDGLRSDMLNRLGLDEANSYDLEAFIEGRDVADPDFLEALERNGIQNPDDLQEIEYEIIERYARQIADQDQGNEIGGESRYAYDRFQRLAFDPSTTEEGYFEIGVTHPSMEDSTYRHYRATTQPLIGHIRGTFITPDTDHRIVHLVPSDVADEESIPVFKARTNSVVIEELQSDVQKGDYEQKGPLRQVHGTLFKAAVQEALERGADTVYLPTSIPISSVRGRDPGEYTSIYDQQVVKEGLNPLKKIPGVTVKPIEHEGQVTYYEIDFTPEAKEYILSGPGQLAPGYARGGLARGGLGRKSVVRRAEEGVVEDRPPKLEGTQIVKEPGGNWIPGSVENFINIIRDQYVRARERPAERLARLEKQVAEGSYPHTEQALAMDKATLEAQTAIDRWLEKKLANYIRNDMATERDPVRLGVEQRVTKAEADKAKADQRIAKQQAKIAEARAAGRDTTAAEQRLEIEMADLAQKYELDRMAAVSTTEVDPIIANTAERSRQGRGIAVSPEAAIWEDMTDYLVDTRTAGGLRSDTPYDTSLAGIANQAPWLNDVPYDTPVYSVAGSTELFDHIRDELYNAVWRDSNLPPNLRLEPKDLEKMNVDAVVAHVGKINAYREQNRIAEKLSQAESPAVFSVKQYPGTGLEWKQIKMPESELAEGETIRHLPEVDMWGVYDPQGGTISSGATEREALGLLRRKERTSDLQKALEYEGNVMGHCVGGYCPRVESGQTQIFSLRDAKGEPHVTIEVRTRRTSDMSPLDFYHSDVAPQSLADRLSAMENENPSASFDWEQIIRESPEYKEYLEFRSERPPDIVQIKGKGNRKPTAKYIPYVQDFIKSGNFGEIGDLQNTDLFKVTPGQRLPGFSKEIPPGYYTIDEFKQMAAENEMPQEILDVWMKKLDEESVFNYADGGRVNGEDYDEEKIESIVAPLREKLKGFLGEAQKVPRKAKQAVADITEIGDIIERSKKIPLEYYDPKSEVAGEADAMRHLLFQAQLARKYGETPAKIMSYMHEYTSPGQPSAEREMDFYNDALGRELGLAATSDEELIELARKYVDTGRVRVLPEEQRGGY